jgi:hypothetical protein
VVSSADLDFRERMYLNADSIGQKAVLYKKIPD